MDEHEFDAFFQRPFGREDAVRADAQLRRSGALAVALWGRSLDDLRRQLLARYPEIPPGFDLADFRELQRIVMVDDAARLAFSSQTILDGIQSLTALEVRCEILRRAIEYLESR